MTGTPADRPSTPEPTRSLPTYCTTDAPTSSRRRKRNSTSAHARRTPPSLSTCPPTFHGTPAMHCRYTQYRLYTYAAGRHWNLNYTTWLYVPRDYWQHVRVL